MVRLPSVVINGWFTLVIVELIVADLILLATVRLVSVPNVVIFGWLAVVIDALIDAASIAPVMLMDCKPVMLVIFASAELKTPALTVPVAVKFAVLIVPATSRFCKPLIAVMFANAELKLPAFTIPSTVRLANAPTLVIFGWLAIVSIPLIVPVLILFTTSRFCKPLSTVMFASAVLNIPVVVVPDTVRLFAKMLPFTVKPVRLPKVVILFKVLGANVPLKVPPSIIPGTVKLLIVPLNALITPAFTVPDTVRFVVLIVLATVKF